MPVLRVDEDVLIELQRRAVDLGLVFGTPNQGLKEVLGLQRRTDRNDISNEGSPSESPDRKQVTTAKAVKGGGLTSYDPNVQKIIDQMNPPLLILLESTKIFLGSTRFQEGG